MESLFLDLAISNFIVVLQLDLCVDNLGVSRLLVELAYLGINRVFHVGDNSGWFILVLVFLPDVVIARG